MAGQRDGSDTAVPQAAQVSSGSETGPAGEDPIKHVIVLMFENRSFDQMLGALQAVYPDLDGVAPGDPPRQNADEDAPPVEQAPAAVSRMTGDPKHELPNALFQLGNNNGNFVRDYAWSYPRAGRDERQQVMAYFPLDALPSLHTLAREFTVCDRWFSSLPGSTWPNRLFVHSGTSIGRAEMPQGPFDLARHRYDQDTIYDRLDERKVAWKIYFGDVPQSMLLMHQWRPENAQRYRPMDEFFRDAAGPHYQFPAYSFIEPRYYAPNQSDDHPPHDVSGAQRLLADVYNAIRANRELWESTLLVVCYDEHGGFYDHVSPPPAVPPDEHRDEYTFDRYGVRVPAVLVSPWVGRGVEHTLFDHTSILKYLIDKWGLGPLGERAGQANSIGGVLRLDAGPRQDTPQSLHAPEPDPATAAAEAAEATELNELQMAMATLAMYLQLQSPGDPKQVLDRLRAMAENPAAKARFAAEAVQEFVRDAEQTVAKASSPLRPKKVVTKGHRGAGGQGKAHRKKVTVKKIRHQAAQPGKQKGAKRLRPA